MKTIEILDSKIFKSNASDEENKEVLQVIKEIGAFFEKTIELDVILNLITRREEMDLFKGFKTPIWMAGYSDSKKRIVVIFDKNSFNGETNHPMEEYYSTLKHEFCHVIFYQLFKFREPFWLNEGLAGFISNQIFPQKKLDITKMHTFDEWKLNGNYSASLTFLKFLVSTFGVGKLVLLINHINNKSRKEFLEIFKSIYNKDLDSIVDSWMNSS